MIEPRVITAAPKLSVTIDEVRKHLPGASDTDANLPLFIEAAENYVKARAGITVHQTTYELALSGWPAYDDNLGVTGIELPRATPLLSIDSVIYKDTSAVTYTLASTEYVADTDNIPGRFVLGYAKSWPSDSLYHVSPIRIQYTAGLAITSPATDVQAAADIKYPVLVLVGAMYENREAVVVSDMANVSQLAIQYGVESYIAKLKVEYAF